MLHAFNLDAQSRSIHGPRVVNWPLSVIECIHAKLVRHWRVQARKFTSMMRPERTRTIWLNEGKFRGWTFRRRRRDTSNAHIVSRFYCSPSQRTMHCGALARRAVLRTTMRSILFSYSVRWCGHARKQVTFRFPSVDSTLGVIYQYQWYLQFSVWYERWK